MAYHFQRISLVSFIANPFILPPQPAVMILGGLLIPLDFFPDWLAAIARALPFAYTLYGPARLFVEPTLERFGALALAQGVWIALMAGVLLWLTAPLSTAPVRSTGSAGNSRASQIYRSSSCMPENSARSVPMVCELYNTIGFSLKPSRVWVNL